MKKIMTVVLCVIISGFIPYMSTVSANSNKEQVTIQDLSVNGTNGNYVIKGIIPEGKEVYYTVEDGHNELIAKKKVPLSNHKFLLEIHLNKKELPANGTVILYFSEEGKEPYSVVLETFS
ncbi:hypothetical protein AB3U99_06430 [Niallia sp. JL1B1071]|uniref:hypothetical protein n=1 Tax=Niallia tiangongensis TaxID=3237105 RepID=UPI0037DDAFEC